METREGNKPLRIHDAIPWSAGALLLAIDTGLRIYTPATGTTAPADFPEPAERATTLVRDGLGRLWMGGEKGLWLSQPGAKALESLDRVPWIGRGTVRGLAPDPQQTNGVIVALGSRGVAFVRAMRTP
jgi:ligand-binding sensor domain-containing protein